MSREPIHNPRKFQLQVMSPKVLCGIRRRFHRLSPCCGYVAHALRTLAPVAAKSIATFALPLDLHVLSLPLAFILSQDQTLHCIKILFLWLWDTLKRIYACSFTVATIKFLLVLLSSNNSINLPPPFERDCKDTHLLLSSKSFQKYFSHCDVL